VWLAHAENMVKMVMTGRKERPGTKAFLVSAGKLEEMVIPVLVVPKAFLVNAGSKESLVLKAVLAVVVCLVRKVTWVFPVPMGMTVATVIRGLLVPKVPLVNAVCLEGKGTKVLVAVKETLVWMVPKVPPVRKVHRVNAASLESLVSLDNVASMATPVMTVQQV
jgi:hypothetical protein